MRHVRPFSFDDLEARRLLSTVHHAAESPPADVAGPLALDGSLAVNSKAAKFNIDEYGDQITDTPVSGVLAGVGMVRGTWEQAADVYGTYLGPDTIQLHNSRGSFTIAFDSTTFGQGIQTAQGTVYDVATQQLQGGSGAYSRASERGYIQENTNAHETVIQSLTLSSDPST